MYKYLYGIINQLPVCGGETWRACLIWYQCGQISQNLLILKEVILYLAKF